MRRDPQRNISHQPRPSNASATSWDPLVDDPNWRYEAHTPYRRMMHGRTVVTLFEPQDEHAFLLYTIAHLPGEVGQEITECAGPAYPNGNSWLVRQHAGSWVAFLPLGAYTRETKDGGDWTFLQFADDILSGNITEIADAGDYVDPSDYCSDLAGRNVQFDDVNATAQIETTPPGGTEVTIRLDYASDTRWIDFGNGFVAQPDPGFIDRDFMHVEPVSEPPWLSWTADFRLEVNRAPHDPVVLDFGDPTLPSPPQTVTVKDEVAVNTPPIKLRWDHGVDDGGIVEYKIWRNGVEVASVFHDDPNDPFNPGSGRIALYDDPIEPNNGGVPAVVQYQIESVDGDEKHSLVTSMIKEVIVQAAPPTAPMLNSAVGGVRNVALSWTLATDNWGIWIHQVFRDGSLLATVSNTTDSYVDTSVLPDQSYDYAIRAYDLAGLAADSATVTGTTPVDDIPPTAPPDVTGSVVGTTTAVWWGDATDDWGIYAYEVLRDGTVVKGTNQTYCFETDMPPGTYSYTVRAIDWGANRGPETPPVVLTVP